MMDTRVAPHSHSKWAPSQAHRWLTCPASVRACEGITPPPPSSYAQEGSAMAAAAEHCLHDAIDPDTLLDQSIEGHLITLDDIEALKIYLDYIRSLDTHAQTIIIPEVRLDLSILWPGLYGHADAIVIVPEDHALHIIDLKFGRGVFVEATDNPQLAIYGLAALLHYEGSTQGLQHIHLTIIQPRYDSAEKIRTWTLTPYDLQQWGITKLLPGLRATEDVNARYVPGEHCRFCLARSTCPALRDHAIQLAQSEFNRVSDLGNDELAAILTRADLIGVWVSAVRDEALARAERGETIPGFILAPMRATRRWKGSEDEMRTALMRLGLTHMQIFANTMRSPAQIEKLMKKEDRAELRPLITNESTGRKLVRDDGRMPAQSRVEQDFAEPEWLR